MRRPVDPIADTDLLDRVRAEHEAEVAAGQAKLVAVVAFAAGHRIAGVADLAEGEVYADHEVVLAGPGAPGVSEFAVVELAAVLGLSARAAKGYVGDGLELAHRLPRLWARVVEGDLPAWKARSVAQRTKQLSAAAAAWVDERVGAVAHTLGFIRVNQLIEQAITMFDAETEAQEAECLAGQVHVTITPTGAGAGGVGLGDLAHVEALIALPDALALESAVATCARALLTTHPHISLDERRALALGALANSVPAGADTARPGRHLALSVHLGEPDLAPRHLARVRTSRGAEHLVTTEAIASWCQTPHTTVSIRPVVDAAATGGRVASAASVSRPPTPTPTLDATVAAPMPVVGTAPTGGRVASAASVSRPLTSIDLAAPITCHGYPPSPRLREQILMLSPTCAFPSCPVPAEGCDLDHITPWNAGGTTTTLNMAPLCRLHHRAKTFAGWTYQQAKPGTYHWTSPSGHHYQRDRDGTVEPGV